MLSKAVAELVVLHTPVGPERLRTPRPRLAGQRSPHMERANPPKGPAQLPDVAEHLPTPRAAIVFG